MEDAPAYWLTPVNRADDKSAEERIATLVGAQRVYALGNRTQNREFIKPGDWICFYISKTGVVAHARVLSAPELSDDETITRRGRYPWVFKLAEPCLYPETPVEIDWDLREKLEGLGGRPPYEVWGWFVMSTRKLSRGDFQLLTGGRHIPVAPDSDR